MARRTLSTRSRRRSPCRSTIEPAGAERVKVTLDGQELELAEAGWSDWVTVDFTFGGFMSVSGIVRLHLVEAFPELKLYVSPIQLDPRAPAGPISMPPDYAAELAERIGLYHTIGMPEETWSLNEERISDQAYLEMVETILAEREAMLFDTLEQGDSELVTQVFVQTDRVSHMFWRGLDPQHPLYDESDERARSAIKWIYGEADRILGRVMAAMKPEDRLIVLSDHGFDSFRRAVHLNRWLADQGYLALKPGQPASESLFANVDWTKTKAFALGLNGIFLNLRDREALGIVRTEDAEALKQEIADKLTGALDPETGETMVATVYDGDEIYQGAQTGDAPDLVIGYARRLSRLLADGAGRRSGRRWSRTTTRNGAATTASSPPWCRASCSRPSSRSGRSPRSARCPTWCAARSA